MASLLERFRRRISGALGPMPDPLRDVRPPAPIVDEQVKKVRGFTPAKPALPWSDDIRKHNDAVDRVHTADAQARFEYLRDHEREWPPALRERVKFALAEAVNRGAGPQECMIALENVLWSVVDVQVFAEGRTANVTHQGPQLPALSEQEHAEARTIGGLSRRVDVIEMARDRGLPPRPSREEVLAQAGTPERAAAVEKKLDEIFGPREEAHAGISQA